LGQLLELLGSAQGKGAHFEGNKLSSLRRDMNTFLELKGEKCKTPLNIWKNGFYAKHRNYEILSKHWSLLLNIWKNGFLVQVLDFKILCPTSKL
jgi:hypothetical protein